MLSDQDKPINTRDKNEKKINIESFTKICLCLERKQDKSQLLGLKFIYTTPKNLLGSVNKAEKAQQNIKIQPSEERRAWWTGRSSRSLQLTAGCSPCSGR